MKLPIEDFKADNDHHFFADNTEYNVKDLFDKAKDKETFDLPLVALKIDFYPWEETPTIKTFLFHVKRVNEADLSYPVILDDNGNIADGWHRICKAALEGKETVKAVRLTEMPRGQVYPDDE